MLTEEQIQFLNKVCPNRWAEENGVINVNGDVDISSMNLTQIPVQFGKVTRYFDCSYNQLTNLKKCPKIVKKTFCCQVNKLTTLEGGPHEVEGYSCAYNQLTNLIGAPVTCNGNFYCGFNQLTSLKGCPKYIRYYLTCNNNKDLHILYGIGLVESKIEYDNKNDLNEWIIKQARNNIFVTRVDIATWIKDTNNYQLLLGAPEEIRQYFSPRILHLAVSGVYNESKILDYKTFLNTWY